MSSGSLFLDGRVTNRLDSSRDRKTWNYLSFLSLYSTTYKQLSSSVSKFFSKLKVLRYRRSGGRTALSDHQNTGNFTENPNSMVPRAGLGGFEKLIFASASRRLAAGRWPALECLECLFRRIIVCQKLGTPSHQIFMTI